MTWGPARAEGSQGLAGPGGESVLTAERGGTQWTPRPLISLQNPQFLWLLLLMSHQEDISIKDNELETRP